MKVIICAAGKSRRMGKLTEVLPKPLLPIYNTTLLENLLFSLSKAEIKEVIIIVGYLGDLIKDKIGHHFNNINIIYITNDDFSSTNNMYSIFLAKEHIDQSMIFVSADVLLTPKTCRAFVDDKRDELILVDNNCKYFNDDDPVKVSINQNKIYAIDKKLKLNMVNGIACGMYKLSSLASKDFFKLSGEFIMEGKVNHGYIEPIKQMLSKHQFQPYYIKDQLWYDIDTPEEYSVVKELIKRAN